MICIEVSPANFAELINNCGGGYSSEAIEVIFDYYQEDSELTPFDYRVISEAWKEFPNATKAVLNYEVRWESVEIPETDELGDSVYLEGIEYLGLDVYELDNGNILVFDPDVI